MAAGSFTVDGTLNLFILIPLVIATALVGDMTGYLIGHKFAYWIKGNPTSRFRMSDQKLISVSGFLSRWGVWSIFLTRWLITPFAVPINLVAGISSYPFRKFMLVALLGESLWAGIYIYLGYLFGANWENLLDYLDKTPLILALLVIGGGSFYLAYRLWRKNRIY
jgi:membrane protein DedA with SNARE-associated domain